MLQAVKAEDSALIISTSSHSTLLTCDLHEFVEDAMRSSLAGHAKHVLSMDVSLSDANALLGGSDKRVVVRIHLRDGQQLVAKSLAVDLDAAITRSAELVARVVRRCSRGQQRDAELPVFGLRRDRRLPSQVGA